MSGTKGSGIDFDSELTPIAKPILNINWDLTPASAKQQREKMTSEHRAVRTSVLSHSVNTLHGNIDSVF